ncbi:MAG: transglutaminase domain-containing protein [Blautia sp.]|nr:transglutaminase domain-containing protein [Blautia sp.]
MNTYFIPNIKLRSIVFLLLLFCTALSGCDSKPVSDDRISFDMTSSLPFIPEASGETVLGQDPLLLDTSNMNKGYMAAISTSPDHQTSVQMTNPDGTTYSYYIAPLETAFIPFTGGNGSYLIVCYEQISGTMYSALSSEVLDISLENEYYPFLYPNQYVNFTPDAKACVFASGLLTEDASDIDLLDAIYTYVTENIEYDYEKAQSVEAGYLPDIDETFDSGKGICFDYAALIASMLRYRGIPCKLNIGYAADIKHAWIDVFIKSKGWVQNAISFEGDEWSRMDPTFDSANAGEESIYEYIGDGSNYTVLFTR